MFFILSLWYPQIIIPTTILYLLTSLVIKGQKLASLTFYSLIFHRYLRSLMLIISFQVHLRKISHQNIGSGDELNISLKEIWVASWHIKMCLSSHIIREMQIKRELRFHTREKSIDLKDWKQLMLAGMWWKRSPSFTPIRNIILFNSIENIMEIFQESKSRAPIQCSN